MCEIDFWDDEAPSVWREDEVKARKTHRCSCCHRDINSGESYVRHFSVFDGYPYDEKLCSDCKKDRETFFKAHGGFMSNPTGFREFLSNCIDPHDEESIIKWRPMLEAIYERGARTKSEDEV